jgi:hypothetical protein
MLRTFILPPFFFLQKVTRSKYCAFLESKHQRWSLSSVPVDFGRSLIAAYLLVLNGYSNVYHLEGGLYTWFKEGLPAVEGEE